jgi:16S rRNA (guanine966-N2)-methyltransferase
MRQSVFSSLGERVVGARFMDLFAGSGAYGLEALSRGAAGGVFVEKNGKAVACLRRNIASVCKSLGRDEGALHILQMDAAEAPMRREEVADLIFIDPPYELITSISERLFSRLGELPPSNDERLVIFEMPGEIELKPPGWRCVKRLGKGVRQPTVAFFRQVE